MLFTVLAKECGVPPSEPYEEMVLNTKMIREARRRFDGTTKVDTDYGKSFVLSMRWNDFIINFTKL